MAFALVVFDFSMRIAAEARNPRCTHGKADKVASVAWNEMPYNTAPAERARSIGVWLVLARSADRILENSDTKKPRKTAMPNSPVSWSIRTVTFPTQPKWSDHSGTYLPQSNDSCKLAVPVPIKRCSENSCKAS